MLDRWYAVRTRPNAQQPSRMYSAEAFKVRKGYRLASCVNETVSQIEKALMDAGFDCWMPSEARLVRDRRRPYLFKARRLALLPGYVLVREPHCFEALLEVPGVYEIVRNGEGYPASLSISDVVSIRRAEARQEVVGDKAQRVAEAELRAAAKVDPDIRRIIAGLDDGAKWRRVLNGLPLAA